ncbi:MAG: sigma-70 family RNA polymerase sigma factor [Bacteroidota bacterium]
MEINQIWDFYKEEMYFFIRKRLQDKDAADEVLQNTFLKVCLYLDSLKAQEKLSAWIFQIARNEIVNYLHQSSKQKNAQLQSPAALDETYEEVCCLDRFVTQLPSIYRETIELLYFKGKKQHEVAAILGISLSNVKARAKRGKSILKKNLQDCCQYDLNHKGKLVGEPDCMKCTH